MSLQVLEQLPEEEMFRRQDARRMDLIKVNLRYEQGVNGEGIWALPCTEEDLRRARDDKSLDEDIFVWLCNDPVCKDVLFGSKVRCLSNGRQRPFSAEIASPEAREAYNKVAVALSRRG